MVVKLGFKKIVVAPYFLFGGKLIGRIHTYIDKVATENPDISFYKANYLSDQAHVINTSTQRIEETIAAPKPAISLMESFKERFTRGEVDVHHHHAEFQPDPEDEEARQAKHSHDHSHAHARYKHIGHPHGPRTMINENLCCCFIGQFPQAIIAEEKAKKPEIPGTLSCKK